MSAELWWAYSLGYDAAINDKRSPFTGHEWIPLHAAWCLGFVVATGGDPSDLHRQIYDRLAEQGHPRVPWGLA